MRYLPELTEGEISAMNTDTFYGFDRSLKAPDGTWFEESGLSSRAYPLFAPRVRRGKVTIGDTAPARMICKDKLAWVGTDRQLYYDNVPVKYKAPGAAEETAVVLTAGDKHLVSMGAYLCVFPDGFYVNTQRLSDAGYMGCRREYVRNEKVKGSGEWYTQERDKSGAWADVIITLSMCSADGDSYDGAAVSAAEPVDPVNGQYWIDTGEKTHALKKYSESQGLWVTLTSTYVKIAKTGIGVGFSENDAVTISGLEYFGTDAGLVSQVQALNGSRIIQACGDDYIIIPGILDRTAELNRCALTIERRVPALDYVCELDNRLWGCRYGYENGENVNTIYATAQGDCTNWYRYAGISTDSYAVNVGSDGPFTGMTAYGGYVLAFKERCVHKVYGSLPSNFTVMTTQLRGVAEGSADSLAIVNETLFYLSRNGVMAYDGSMPASVFDAFGGEQYFNGHAGALGNCYYLCADNAAMENKVWVYDSSKGIWHHEDDTRFTQFVPVGSDLFGIDSANNVWSMSGSSGDKEEPVTFDAVSGIIGYGYPDRKYLSRFVMRVKMALGDDLEVLTRYDSAGPWESQGTVHMAATDSFTLPVIPRRCDHMQIRIRGRGDVRIFSIAKTLEVGSDA